jgi:hypothetical protein
VVRILKLPRARGRRKRVIMETNMSKHSINYRLLNLLKIRKIYSVAYLDSLCLDHQDLQ